MQLHINADANRVYLEQSIPTFSTKLKAIHPTILPVPDLPLKKITIKITSDLKTNYFTPYYLEFNTLLPASQQLQCMLTIWIQ